MLLDCTLIEAMDFLVESGIFGVRKDAVLAAIEFCLGNYAQFRGVDIRLIMPLQLDAKGNVIGVPSNSNEWEKKERELGLLRKVSHDAEEELVSELELFCEKYPALSSDQFVGPQAWPREVAGALILLFFSDRSMALNALPILREFLKKYKTFRLDKLNENLLTRIHKPRKSGRRQ